MADLSIRTTATGDSDYRWLVTKRSRQEAVSVTIDTSLLQAGTHYDDYGRVPSGLALGKLTGQDSYGPYDPDATDGRGVLAGFLTNSEQLHATFTRIDTTSLQTAMVVDGIIDPSHVPNTPTLNQSIPTTGSFVWLRQDYAATTLSRNAQTAIAALTPESTLTDVIAALTAK